MHPNREDDFFSWLYTDEPIASIDRDWFRQLDTLADDINQRLIGSQYARVDQPHRPSLALLGSVGSGKTSAAKCVESLWAGRSSGRIWVRTSVWAFADASAAQRGLLDALRNGLAAEVSTLPILHLPDRYAAAANTLGGWLGGLLRIAERHEPEVVLKEIERICERCELQVVFWVEDLERFAAEGSAKGSAQSLHALLYQLSQLRRLTLVVATDGLNRLPDVGKLGQHWITMPRLPRDRLWEMLCAVAESASAHQGWQAHRNARFFVRDRIDEPLAHVVGKVPRAQICADLLDTPRKLKLALREALQRWLGPDARRFAPGPHAVSRGIFGEMLFDQVLLVTTLMAGAPGVYALLDRRMLAIQRWSPPSKDPPAQGGAANAAWLEEINGALETLRDQGKEQAARGIVDQLLPDCGIGSDQKTTPRGLEDARRKFGPACVSYEHRGSGRNNWHLFNTPSSLQSGTAARADKTPRLRRSLALLHTLGKSRSHFTNRRAQPLLNDMEERGSLWLLAEPSLSLDAQPWMTLVEAAVDNAIDCAEPETLTPWFVIQYETPQPRRDQLFWLARRAFNDSCHPEPGIANVLESGLQQEFLRNLPRLIGKV